MAVDNVNVPNYNQMKSTWRTMPFESLDYYQQKFIRLRINPTKTGKEVPVHPKTDKVPGLPRWQGHAWILPRAIWPLLVQQAYCWIFGHNLHPVAAYLLYAVAFKVNALQELRMMCDLGHRYGFLDGDKHERDQVPDNAAGKVFRALFNTSTFRPMLAIFFAYNSGLWPSSVLTWWTPLEIGVYGIVLDFWYYWYHRLLHCNDGLWKYHRTHHLTKHPTPLLTIYTDHVQETFDIAVIPALTWATMRLAGFPMGFYELWMCHQYVVWTELFGHSGVRVWVTPPTTATPLLRLFNAELITEDHDLHHRKGWKKSHNYGKQTLLWDRAFGTCLDRVECTEDNIDWEHPAHLKFW